MTVVAGVSVAAYSRARLARTGRPGFQIMEEEAQAVETTSAPVPAGLPGLLAMQESESAVVQDREARQHGADLMAELAILQRALLGGSETDLHRLSELARRSSSAADPRLAAVLRAVQVRAGIELARRGMLRHPGDSQNRFVTGG